MNGNIKFHKATGPAFMPGEQWKGGSGGVVTIVAVRPYIALPKHNSDYGVTYTWEEQGKSVYHEKDAWNFQVRYTHQADLNIRKDFASR